MSNIFVSYSRRDLEIVDRIVGEVERAGIKVWIDREDIKAGRTWRAQIVEAIDTCDAFVLMLSSNSAVSDNVRKEVVLAQDSGRTVFIMRLDSVEKLPAEMRYQLVGLQYVDLQTSGMDDAVNQLIDTLEEHFATLKPAKEQMMRETELVFQGDPAEFDAKEQAQTIDLISALTDTPASNLDITNLTGGSVHVFIKMPATAAFKLKTQALNRDRRLRKFGIKSMRLTGDKKYVNIALGMLTATATIGFLNMLWMSTPSLLPSQFGVAVGKVLVITTALVVTTAAGIAIPPVIALTLNPTPTMTPTAASTQISIPRDLLVINDTLYWDGPGYTEMSSVMAGIRVELPGRGNITGWLIVLNLIYQVPCWMRISDLQIDPDYDLAYLPIFTPPAQPPSEKGNIPDITPTRLPPCVYAGTCIFPILTTPVPASKLR